MEDRELSRSAERRLARRGGPLRAALLLLSALPLGARAEDALAPEETPPQAAPAADWSQQHRSAALAFTEADADRNGRLDPLEATALAPEAFQAADRDGDGKLTLVEWVDARFEAIGAPAAPGAVTRPEAQTSPPPEP